MSERRRGGLADKPFPRESLLGYFKLCFDLSASCSPQLRGSFHRTNVGGDGALIGFLQSKLSTWGSKQKIFVYFIEKGPQFCPD